MEEPRTDLRSDRRNDDRRHTNLAVAPGRDRRRSDRRNRIARAGLVAALTMLGARVHRTGFETDTYAPPSVGSLDLDVEGEDFGDLAGDVPQEYDRAAINQLIDEAAAVHGVDPELVRAVVQTESAFNPSAVSPVGAQGLMQVMPRTARSLGITDPMDPRQNVLGGTKYLGMLLDRFNGNVALALASYNAGPGNVAKYKGIPPFRETRGYVSKIRNIFAQATGQTFAIPATRPARVRASRRPIRMASSGTARSGRGRGSKASARTVSSKATKAAGRAKAKPARSVKSASARGRTTKVASKTKVTKRTAPRRTTARRR